MTNSHPSISTCLKLMDTYSMLENIRDHSAIVAKAAEEVLNRLESQVLEAEYLPARDLIVAGALLHDIAKTRCIMEDCNHAEIGGEICEELGYFEVAEIVREHVRLLEFAPKRYSKGIFLAKEIIYYADKRVLHDKIVSLPERLQYIIERYGNDDPERHRLIHKNFATCQHLETWICKTARCSEIALLQNLTSVRPETRNFLLNRGV